MKVKKSWREKLADRKGLPKVFEVPAKMSQRFGKGNMVIPAPAEVDKLMKQVPRGRLATMNEFRAYLAVKHRASCACPLTTGIFSWIAAHAAEEALAAGAKRVTPYWRTLKTGGELNPKYPGGIAGLTKKLEAEGHRVIQKGSRALVADYQRALFTRFH
jgi:hypothetical protein